MKPKHALIPMISLLMIFVYATTRTGYGLTLPTRGTNQWLYLPTILQPAVFTVNTTTDARDATPGDGFCRTAAGQCSLRAAVQEANAQDEIAFIHLPGGHYALTIAGIDEDNAVRGDLDITNAMQLIGAGANNVIIDANHLDRAFHIKAIEKTVTISGVTITNGYVTTNLEQAGGGGIFNEAGYLFLEQVTITQNEVDGMYANGGGIYNSEPRYPEFADTALEIRDSAVTHNVVLDGNGGGIFASGTAFNAFNVVVSNNQVPAGGGGIAARAEEVLLDHVTIDHNTATAEATTQSGGGGIHLAGYISIIIRDCVISNNSAFGWGGGILNQNGFPTTIVRTSIVNNHVNGSDTSIAGGGVFQGNYSGMLTIEDSTIQNNSSAFKGGGLFHYGNSGSMANVYIKHSTIAYNQAEGFGAGIYNQGDLFLTNVTVSHNEVAGIYNQWGGGIYNHDYGNLTIQNSTITENSARTGGGIYRSGGVVTAKNSIIAHNVATDTATGGPNCYGGLTSNGYNLQNDNSCPFNNVGDMNQTNPRIGPLQGNGGLTDTHALLSNSPAIDAGTNAGCPTRDQRGVTRPQDGNGDGNAICDIGSFEK
jgi:CSLREA domain-containing protein